MNISAITSLKTITNNISLRKAITFKGSLSSDTFERTKPQNNGNEAIKWMENTNFINNRMLSIISNPDNKMGQGFQHCVYSIPENDDYVLRVRNGFEADKTLTDGYQIEDIADKNLDINIGQEVARIVLNRNDGCGHNIVTVLKKQKGIPLGIPPYEALKDPGTDKLKADEPEYDCKERKDKFAYTLSTLASMPVSAYEDFLDNINTAHKCGYYFDHLNSNNIMFDEDTGSLGLIDMDKGRSYLNYGNVLYALTNIEYFSTYTGKSGHIISDEENYQAAKNTIEIIDKFFQAMQNKGLKMKREDASYEFMKLFFSVPFCFYCKTMNDNEKWQSLISKGVVE